jgi:hypothetical protein
VLPTGSRTRRTATSATISPSRWPTSATASKRPLQSPRHLLLRFLAPSIRSGASGVSPLKSRGLSTGISLRSSPWTTSP